MTPPLDQEEEDEDSRIREAQARQELENEGCPACYPPDLDVPLRHVPEEYQPIVGYWKSFPGTGDVPLCAQRSDWQRFRVFQRMARRGSQDTPFSKFEDQVRERRRRHGLDGVVRLLLQPEQQSRLEQWIEFQNYQLMRLEWLEKDRDKAEQELDEAREKAQDADDVAGSQRAARDEPAYQQILETAKRDLERHKVFLRWIEQQRLKIEEGGGGIGDGGFVDVVSTRVRRGRQPKASVVLGKVRISKAAPPKRHAQTRKPKAPEARPATQDSDVIPRSRIPEVPKSRETKARHTKGETSLGPHRPQRVTKAKRTIDARATSLVGTHPRGAGQTRPLDRARAMRGSTTQQPQPEAEHVKTRSGRISKPPARWFPE